MEGSRRPTGNVGKDFASGPGMLVSRKALLSRGASPFVKGVKELTLKEFSSQSIFTYRRLR
jgi:hypothetical protein